jgi:hypothetical protein
MKIKDWPLWLKTGILTSILGTLLTIIGMALTPVCGIGEICPLPVIAKIALGILYPLRAIFGHLSGYSFLVGVIFYYFIIGAIIGWVIDIIRRKKK